MISGGTRAAGSPLSSPSFAARALTGRVIRRISIAIAVELSFLSRLAALDYHAGEQISAHYSKRIHVRLPLIMTTMLRRRARRHTAGQRYEPFGHAIGD